MELQLICLQGPTRCLVPGEMHAWSALMILRLKATSLKSVHAKLGRLSDLNQLGQRFYRDNSAPASHIALTTVLHTTRESQADGFDVKLLIIKMAGLSRQMLL